ncbi:hypothetical protein Tco_0337701 [Tanacetum coccineum]
MILGKPFLATIHAQNDVFNGEISFGIGEDRVKFDIDENSHHSNVILEKVYMATEKESFNPLEMEDDLFSYESPSCLRFEQNTRIYTNSDIETVDSPSNMQETSERCVEHQPDNKRDTSRWHVCKPVRVFYDNGEHGMLKQWVKIGHTSVANFDREKVFNEWVLDSFDIEADYAKMFANPYSRRFDEYKRIFINEVEQLSNEYELKIGKNGYILDYIWENVNKTTEVQRTHGTMEDVRKKKFGNVGLRKPNMCLL